MIGITPGILRERNTILVSWERVSPPRGGYNKRYLERHYGSGRRDLYAAFILRSLDLANEGGRVAMVMPQTWMFLRSFADLRAPERTARREKGIGLVSDLPIETLAHLGRHAFSEADPPSNVVMVGWAKANLSPEHRMTCFRLTAPNEAVEQARILRDAIAGSSRSMSRRAEPSRVG